MGCALNICAQNPRAREVVGRRHIFWGGGGKQAKMKRSRPAWAPQPQTEPLYIEVFETLMFGFAFGRKVCKENFLRLMSYLVTVYYACLCCSSIGDCWRLSPASNVQRIHLCPRLLQLPWTTVVLCYFFTE